MDIDATIRSLYLIQITNEHSNEDHYPTTSQLCSILKNEYGMETHRTTIKSDIEMLQQVGIGVKTVRPAQYKYNYLITTLIGDSHGYRW